MIGRTLAHYTVLEKIGEGGMGEVWKAHDDSLGRDVAIKVLPQAFAQDAERLARFEREAMLLAGLDHPGLATVFGLHEADGTRFLAMELVPGADLAHRLAGDALPVTDALEIAVQVAGALEAAHDQGVVHRDLKPSNIMVTPQGKAKVLDFGLAFSVGSESGSSSSMLTQSPTLAGPATAQGVILGTAAYMSPEQARGKPVDRRTDLWAFGAVLYEMLTGHSLFAGETVSDCVARILTSEPDWERLPPDTPPSVRRLIRRCLTRDVGQRQQGAGDARIELEEVLRGGGEASEARPAEAAPARSSGGRWLLVVALLSGCALGALLWNLLSGYPARGTPDSTAKLSLIFPEDLRVGRELLAPDGQHVVFWARSRRPTTPEEELFGVYVRPLDDFASRFIPGTRGATEVCFSPDGRWLVIAAPSEPLSTKRYLWKVPVDGSAPLLKLMDWDPEWAGLHWLPDGDLVVGTLSREIQRIPTDGGPLDAPLAITGTVPLEQSFEPDPSHGSRLPDGEHLLASVELWSERGYTQNIIAVSAVTGEATSLLENGSNVRWSSTGHLLFSRGSSILAVPFDPEGLTVTGGATALTDDLRIETSWNHGRFGVSGDGTLLYAAGGYVGGSRRLVWVDREFNPLAPWSDDRFPLEEGGLVLAPVGGRFAVVIAGEDGVYDIWMSEPERPILQKWHEEPSRDQMPYLWSPDGSSLVYMSRTESESRFYRRPIDGAEPPTLLFEDAEAEAIYRPGAVADDGRTLLVTRWQGDRATLKLFDLEGAPDVAAMETLVEGGANPAISPDGRWLAYESDASGRVEIYLRRWKGQGALGPERRLSTDGGQGPTWYQAPSGGLPEVWFHSSRQVHSVSVGAGEDPALPRPVVLADWKDEFVNVVVATDGRILMNLRGENEGPIRSVNVIPGWARVLETLSP